ncbi:MAG: LysM peptidoglycan-binding domain-containing protein, partial [Anaerolineae bacterium]|nr:LysM peptidoglycan-binding domain-containing protein [Anaerolineae bacterium]
MMSPSQGGMIMQHMRQIVTVIVALAVLLAVPGLVSAQDGAGQVIHTVQPGENLFRISLKYNTTVEAIALANNITNQNLIYVGQELVIPVESSEQTETPVASVTPVTSPSALPPTPVVSVTPVTSPSALPPTPVASVTPVTSPSAL